MLCETIRHLRIACVAIPLFLTGCAATTIVSDFCLRDGLILLLPGDVKADSVAEGEIVIHNARYECGCMPSPPEWCEP